MWPKYESTPQKDESFIENFYKRSDQFSTKVLLLTFYYLVLMNEIFWPTEENVKAHEVATPFARFYTWQVFIHLLHQCFEPVKYRIDNSFF